MAKMFYTIEEAAQTLGVSEDDVKQMVEDGKLQQFRDRDKVMFKRDQIDQMAPGGGGGGGAPSGLAADDEDDDNEITLMPDDEDTQASKTDSIDLSGDTGEHEAQGAGAGGGGADDDLSDALSLEPDEDDAGAGVGASADGGDEDGEKKKSATGMSVFGADEVEAADAMEETQVGGDTLGDDEINFDGGGGSGSGLLDLTRESDDTSLGAVELLEDVDTEEGQEESGEDENADTMPAATGVFDGGIEEAEPSAGPALGAAAGAGAAAYAIEESDPPGDGFGGGMLLGVFAVLITALLVVMNGQQGVIIQLTAMLSQSASAPWMYGALGGAGLCIVLSLIGWMIGRSKG